MQNNITACFCVCYLRCVIVKTVKYLFTLYKLKNNNWWVLLLARCKIESVVMGNRLSFKVRITLSSFDTRRPLFCFLVYILTCCQFSWLSVLVKSSFVSAGFIICFFLNRTNLLTMVLLRDNSLMMLWAHFHSWHHQRRCAILADRYSSWCTTVQ